MSVQLPLDTYSPDQLSELILELQDAAGQARDNTVRGQADASPQSPNLVALLDANKIAPTDADALETLSKDIAAILDKAPTVHILLSSMPNRPVKRQFALWFRTQIHPLTLITFAARGDLGGGAIIQTGSHLYDMSFRRSIIDNKARLTEIAGV